MDKKQKVRIRIRDSDKFYEINAVLHPRGYMKAKYTHLDIPCDEAPDILYDAAKIHGVKTTCYNRGSCIVLDLLGLSDIEICIEGMKLECYDKIWLTIKKDRTIYLGPVKVKK
ncbi:MAG: hypothetical protein GXO43_05410 [Crenarchaeota archaeon]|nr:hypothetical protein [Thermoproteota archaeon]